MENAREIKVRAIQANHDLKNKTIEITYVGYGLQVKTVGETKAACENFMTAEIRSVHGLVVTEIDYSEIGKQ